MDTTVVVAVAGLVTTAAGTFGAPFLTMKQAAKHTERAAEKAAALQRQTLRDAELRTARMQLYVDLSEWVQYQLGHMLWLTEEYRTHGFVADYSAKNLTGRVELLAAFEVRNRYRDLMVVLDVLEWQVRENADDHDTYGPKMSAEDVQVINFRDALEQLQVSARAAVEAAA